MPFPDFEPSVPAFLDAIAKRFARHPLIVLGSDRLDYAEAERRSADLAKGLLATGHGKGSRIALLMPNGPDWVVAALAAGRIGALLVPVNTFYQTRELGWVLRHADIETLLTVPGLLQHDYLERLEAIAPELVGGSAGALFLPSLPSLRRVVVFGENDRGWADSPDDLGAALAAAPAIDDAFLGAIEAGVHPADPFVQIYSSGSTAEPKGVIHSQGALIRHAFNLNHFRDLRADDRVYSPMPFFWVGGLSFSLLACMHAGACLVCETAFEPEATLRLIEREAVTLCNGWDHFARAMADHPSLQDRDLGSLRGGNMLWWLAPERAPGDPARRSNSLGMTETCGPHTIAPMDHDLPDALRGSFGSAPEGVEHKIVDPETGETLPAGTFGEICVRGYNVMQGLHKVEREATFDADGFYHTGDGGHFDENGVLFFKARLGEMIKTAGANVAPQEVERALDRLEEVQVSFVVGVRDEARGQNVAAAIVLDAEHELSALNCRDRLKADLSAYKVPRHYFFCTRDELPFTDSGKMNKKALAETLEARIAAGDTGTPPREIGR